jgi:tetratricopeptide (TPR) repeat protein
MWMAEFSRIAALAVVMASGAMGQPPLPSLEPLYRQALAGREQAFGPTHIRVAVSLVDLALFLEREGKPDIAEPLLLRAASIYKDQDPAAHAAVLTKLGELAGEGEQAERLLRESLASHATALAASRLAELRERAEDLEAAEKLYRQALDLATTPQEQAAAANSLALVLEARGKPGEAEPFFARAAAAYEKVLGRHHPEFATVLANLAGSVRARGDVDTAAGMLRNAWAVLLQTLGPAHPHTQAACASLADVLNEAGNKDEAAVVQRRCR